MAFATGVRAAAPRANARVRHGGGQAQPRSDEPSPPRTSSATATESAGSASASAPAQPSRRRTHRWRRAALAALITGAVVLPLSAATHAEIPAPAPATLAPLTATTLDEAYSANRANAAEASRMAWLGKTIHA